MIKILSIKGIKPGSIVTRVCPTGGYCGDSSYMGEKMELISITDKTINLKSLETEERRERHLPFESWQYGWRKYEFSGEKKYDIAGYEEQRGQLRVQYVYLGFELDKLRGGSSSRRFEKFADYLTVCRYLEKNGYGI